MLFDIRNIEYQVQDASVLGKLSLNVEAGQPVLLLGSSGCGKTTLLNLMSGLLEASAGDITFVTNNFFRNRLFTTLEGPERTNRAT